MDEYLYLSLNIGSILVPLAYSIVEKKFHFIQYFKIALASLLIVMIPFIVWDAIFTTEGVWGFNERYHLSITFLKLPIEEWLFFICIPYACLFTHESVRYYLPNWTLSVKVTKIIAIMLLIVSFGLAVSYFGRAYTTINLSVFFLLMLFTYLKRIEDLSKYLLSFLIIIFPFLIVNGILTGSLIEQPVVWYNNEQNMGVRIGTIPLEDIFYAFNLLFSTQLIFNHLKRKMA